MLLCCSANLGLAQWTNGQGADLVLGQPDLTSNTPDNGGISATTLDGCSGIAIDFVNGKMYVADEDNHRVLRYAYPITSNQQAAEAVFGQADFASSSPATTASGMNLPAGVAVYNNTLWVADSDNDRVLRFDNAATKTNGAAADGVLGQADFTSSSFATTATGMFATDGVYVDNNGTLWVADTGNERVLRFDDAANKSNGAAADGVLGQADFTSATEATTASGMNQSRSVFVTSDGTLWVAERNNHRVLRFDDAANKSNGAAADGVLGQADFTSNGSATTATGMGEPMSVTVDASGRLYVADKNNSRVLIFDDAANKSNGAAADNVLGQADFDSGGAGISASTMNGGFRSAVVVDNANNWLWVSDSDNNRVIRFTASSALPVEFTFFKGQATAKGNALHWQTASEENNEGFEVQRSSNGKEWTMLGFVAGNGTTIETQDYSFLDTDLAGFQNLRSPTLYYRLKQVDFDGTYEYSDIISINYESSITKDELTVFPNPATEVLNYQVANMEAVRSVELYDVFGKLVKVAAQLDGQLSLADLTTGMYVLVVETERERLRSVVVKN